MKKSDQQKRICSHCGIAKPLNAFLLLTEERGTVYGTVCSTCRASLTQRKDPEDERSTGSSSLRIGAKEKIEAEQQKKLYIKALSEAKEKESKKREDIQQDKKQAEIAEKKESAHRKSLFSNKQTRDTVTVPRQTTQQTGPEDQPHKDQQQREIQSKEDAREQETRLTQIDSHRMYVNDQLGYRSQVRQQFENWLGKRPFTQLSQLYKKPTDQTKGNHSSEQTSDKKNRPKG